MTEVAREEGRGRVREREGGREGVRGRGRELWVFWAFFDIIDGCVVGCGINKEGFLILPELCTVYFAFQYAAVFDPAAGFQARRLLV